MKTGAGAFLILAIMSCTNPSGDNGSVKDTVVIHNREHRGNNEINISGCYVKILKRDTMVLHLEQSGINVSGKMSFDNYEKDGSSGELQGVIEKDIVKMWYNFQSEGISSVMELYFKIENSSLIQGVGPVTNKGDTTYFIDRSVVDFSIDQSFAKTDCSVVPSKYLFKTNN